jgi:hypothetical protein
MCLYFSDLHLNAAHALKKVTIHYEMLGLLDCGASCRSSLDKLACHCANDSLGQLPHSFRPVTDTIWT